MAPKKAPAIPKKTIEEVNEEYSAKQSAAASRIEQLKKALSVAKKECDAARLDLVATRENRVFYDARVAAMSASNEAFDLSAKSELEVLKQTVKQVKRSGKDKGYEVNYVREVASGVEREVETIQTSIDRVEADARKDPLELERELDRLAFVVGGLAADRPRLQRTIVALEAAKERIDRVAPRRMENAAPSLLQLTIIGGSSLGSAYSEDSVRNCFAAPLVRAASSCVEVLGRAEEALVHRCGFEVVERITPDVSSWPHRSGSSESIEQSLRRRVESALTQAASAPHRDGTKDVHNITTQSLVLIHCPSRSRRVVMADGSTGPQTEVVLLISQMSDAAKQFLRASPAGRGLDWDGVGTVEIPLNTVLAMTLASSHKKHVAVLIDTWPAPVKACDEEAASRIESISDELPSVSFAMFWARSTMLSPLLYTYRSPFDPSLVRQRHADATNLEPSQQFPRACMLETLSGLVEGSSAAHLLDFVSVGRSIEALMTRRFACLVQKMESPTGALATLALTPKELRTIHHTMPLHLRPLPSPQPLHVEGRCDTPEFYDFWLRSEPLPSQYKWCRRGALVASKKKHAPLGQNALLRTFAEECAAVPHVRVLVDVAVEDPHYHISYEDVEDLDIAKVLQHPSDKSAGELAANISLDVSQVAEDDGDNVSKHGRISGATCRRNKRLVTDSEEWGDLVSRRVRQALISADEEVRFIRQTAERADGERRQLQQILPSGLQEPETGPIKFTVQCNPLDEGTREALHGALDPCAWFVEGKRCPERTAEVELTLLLDVKTNNDVVQTFAHVTQAKDALAHSLKRALELLCESLDTERPQDAFVQVAYNVTVFRRGGPHDDARFIASVRLAAIITERALQERGVPESFIVAKHWLRSTLTHAVRRWGVGWMPCAETTLASSAPGAPGSEQHEHCFRVIRVFHVLRNWECGLRLQVPTNDSSLLSEGQTERHIAWLLHLIRLVHAQGGFAGGGRSVAEGTDHRGPEKLVRLLEVKEFPKFAGLQRRALVHGQQAPGDGTLGPGSTLNNITEAELSVALRILSAHPTRPTLTMACADTVESAYASSFQKGDHSVPVAPSTAGLVLLTWLIPQSFLRVIQQTPPHRTDEAVASVSEVLYLVRSLVEHFHHQQRLGPVDSGHPDVYTVATTVLEFDDLHIPEGTDVLTVEALRVVDAQHNGHPLPLGELGINRDEGDSTQPPVTTGVASPVDEQKPSDASTAQTHPTEEVDNPAEYDESYRVLKGACLCRHPVHGPNPLGSLFPLSPRFWDEVQTHHAAVLTNAHKNTLAAKVGLVATTWVPSTVHDAHQQQPHVRSLTIHSYHHGTVGDPLNTSSALSANGADGRLPLRSRVVDLFLQSCIQLAAMPVVE